MTVREAAEARGIKTFDGALLVLVISNATAFAGYLFHGWLGDRIGRRSVMLYALIFYCVFTLFAAWLLDLAGLPQDLLRNLAIVLLFLIAQKFVIEGITMSGIKN